MQRSEHNKIRLCVTGTLDSFWHPVKLGEMVQVYA